MEDTKEYRYKVSIVTAVYNVEEYLAEMIGSIIGQTIGFEYVQLILIDDGSDDKSGELCDQYAEQYPRNIIVIHKENGGVSSARNAGLDYVQGEYVNFMDADDMLESNALELMYGYLNQNEQWIDLVAVPLKFFGAANGGHPLNYKFKKTRLIDLRKEYDCVQLTVSGALVKKKCFDNRRFETALAYAEDAQLVIDILLEKMQYGVVSGTNYLYRKRGDGSSAIDSGRLKKQYYVSCVQKFILFSIRNAYEKTGYLPRFVQYSCMYDLQWRINKTPLVNPGVLDVEEEQKYKELIVQALQYIDDGIILEQKNLSDNYKMAVLELKEENKGKKKLIPYSEDLKVCIGDYLSAAAGSYSSVFEFIEVMPEEIVIEGYVRYFAELNDIDVILKAQGEGGLSAEYRAKRIERGEKCSFCMGKMITKALGFRFYIKRAELYDITNFSLWLRYKDHDILCRNIQFGKFFPLARQLKNSYFSQNNILLTYQGKELIVSKIIKRTVLSKCEKRFQQEILSKRDRMSNRGWIARRIYHTLAMFKKKELWLISDRLTKADDNGEAFFTYMNTTAGGKKIDTYFVLEKESPDYERLCRIGKVVSFHSIKHKILSLMCDKIISSQGEDYVINRFNGLSYMYKDIQHRQKFVFLQHGVTKDDLSRWLRKDNKNISLFVTVTNMEYQSILENPYYYDKGQVQCTGFPRYDYLCDNSAGKNVITFMPTWRSYLVGNIDPRTDRRALKKGFEKSAYYQMYQQVFSNQKLFDAVQKYHYHIKLMLHPAMPEECIPYFDKNHGCDGSLEILDRKTRYKELFAESKLIITDYSSTVFDFAYLGKPVIYYQQDVQEFFSGNHTYEKGYFDYEKDGFGEVEYSADALVNRIIEYMENDCQLKQVYRNRIQDTFRYHDRNNCKRVYDEIVKL